MKREWLFFWLVALIWGSSFLFMRIGVEEVPPAQIAFTRTGIAAVCMNIVLLLTRRRYPSNLQTFLLLMLLGVVNTGLPFALLAWGEQTVESGMTGVLQAITPVFAVVIAHFAFADERITPMKILGVVVSFSGILVLTSRDLTSGSGLGSDLSGEIAILIASLCYGIGTNFSRKMIQKRAPDTVVVAAVTMIGAALATLLLTLGLPLLGERAPVSYASLSGDILQIMLVLGFFNTFIAYLMFYKVIAGLGGARASMVTYVIPVISVALGALFLDELIDGTLLIGSALILAGLVLVNGWLKPLLVRLGYPAKGHPQHAAGD
ncbi:MAG: EamA family transporter [Anaerolineae bacterium]|nr:EamA family transporter [Anaerolineae bacterium]